MTSTLSAPTGHGALDVESERLAHHLLHHTAPGGGWTHERLVLAVVSLVRRHGAGQALDLVLGRRPDAHVTRTVFMVWGVDRLIGAGLSTARILWHPLVDRHSILCWWHAETLDGDHARRTWVPPTLTGGDGPDAAVQPPATAGMIDTVSPSRTAVANPSR